jgi:hypothetical protein
MRSTLALVVFATACTSASPSGTKTYDSVRERLADSPTRLYVGTEASTGEITARRWTEGGWIEGNSPITIENGEVVASVDDAGKLTVSKLEVAIAPLDIPEEVFKKPAQLSDVRVKLAKPVTGMAQWSGDDDATATLTLSFDLYWAISINGGKTPLGTQHLPPITVDVMFTGAGDHVDASIALDAMGELWNWAGLIELTRLQLSLAAGTVD